MSPFHKLLSYVQLEDRTSFGLTKVNPVLVRWRIFDLAYVGILVFLYRIVYNIQPFQRQFYVGDITILHPFAETERVSNEALFLYLTWVPMALIFLVSMVASRPADKPFVTYTSVLGLVISVLTTSVLTDVLKNYFGRHRPDFLARCVPKHDSPLNVMVYAKDVCTTDNIHRLMDGFRTTPSGHSSISFAGLFFTSLWLGGQLAVVRAEAGALRWVACFMPTLGAAIIALSRTEDYRHHFVDVFIGLVIGIVVAAWLYLRLFPTLGARRCHEPKLLLQPDLDYSPVANV